MSQTTKPEFQEENKTRVSRLQARTHFPADWKRKRGPVVGVMGSHQRCLSGGVAGLGIVTLYSEPHSHRAVLDVRICQAVKHTAGLL